MATYSQKVLLAATTAVATTPIFVNAEDGASLTIVSSGYAGAENATVQVFDLSANAWVNYIVGGSLQTFDINNNVKDFYMTRAQYRIVKSGTAAPVGFTIYQVGAI